jgi:hypothetical protein
MKIYKLYLLHINMYLNNFLKIIIKLKILIYNYFSIFIKINLIF